MDRGALRSAVTVGAAGESVFIAGSVPGRTSVDQCGTGGWGVISEQAKMGAHGTADRAAVCTDACAACRPFREKRRENNRQRVVREREASHANKARAWAEAAERFGPLGGRFAP